VSGSLSGVWGSSANDVYAVGFDFGANGGLILHKKSANGAWAVETSGTTQWLNHVWGSGPNDIYAVGDMGTILHSTGNGTWTAESVDMLQKLSIWGSAANNVYVVGDQGAILHSTGNGAWTTQMSNTAQILQSVWGTSANDVYAVGHAGVILHWPN
jgi:photosystem II stability/assembly factor-like uncharacterized protein